MIELKAAEKFIKMRQLTFHQTFSGENHEPVQKRMP